VRRESAALFAVLFAATGAQAAPRTIDDCEEIKEAMAYNACLASFGPTRGHHGAVSGAVSGSFKTANTHGTAGAAYSHSRGGRVRMEFTPRSR